MTDEQCYQVRVKIAKNIVWHVKAKSPEDAIRFFREEYGLQRGEEVIELSAGRLHE